MAFKSLRNKLLVLIILLSLLPLVGISLFSYFVGKYQIAEDRIKLALENKAQDTADKIDLVLRAQEQDMPALANTFSLIFPTLSEKDRASMIRLLNNYTFNHEVYVDIFAVVDRRGRIIAVNTRDRADEPLPPTAYLHVMGENISDYQAEKEMFDRSICGLSSHHDWYQSTLVQQFYDYRNQDVSHQYNIAFSEPLYDQRTKEVDGVWIAIINWSYIQNILDTVETDLARRDLKTGYAFMYAKDANTIIAHKYRKNRGEGEPLAADAENTRDLYDTKAIEDHHLTTLHNAFLQKAHSVAYEYPQGNKKISGIAQITDDRFGWIVGVGIDETDIFRPIIHLKWWLYAVTFVLAVLVVVFTFIVAQGITVPIRNVIRTAQTIAQGKLSQRVEIRSSDEVGTLGATFNDMARALEARENQLQELNRNLENMVRQRTQELERSHEALKKAYLDLQSTQEQLVQTEKMASLGQLVAGIAHEIKNPLNFIYGNTGFLSDYTAKLQALLEAYDALPSLTEADKARMHEMKSQLNYDFVRQDLHTLIENFTEGARRINTIVSDLRTFSRMDSDTVSEIDVHASIEVTLNLLSNQYRERVEIHREYGAIPKIHGYSGKLGQVFMNLLSNAFHAINAKGDVWIRTQSLDGYVQVEIEDNGQGIARENLKRIFEPFFTTKPVGQGTGLGLSISYGIIEQHHGKITVASAPGSGTVFTVRLPINQENLTA